MVPRLGESWFGTEMEAFMGRQPPAGVVGDSVRTTVVVEPRSNSIRRARRLGCIVSPSPRAGPPKRACCETREETCTEPPTQGAIQPATTIRMAAGLYSNWTPLERKQCYTSSQETLMAGVRVSSLWSRTLPAIFMVPLYQEASTDLGPSLGLTKRAMRPCCTASRATLTDADQTA